MFKISRKDVCNNAPTYDLKNASLGDALLRLEKQVGWHGLDDSANRLPLYDCSAMTITQACALANDIKAAYTAHIALGATTHKGADATNTIAAANATDIASLDTLLTELRTDINAHRVLTGIHDPASTTGIGNALAQTGVAVAAPQDQINWINTGTATDGTLATALVVLDLIQKGYRAHTFRGPLQIDEMLMMS